MCGFIGFIDYNKAISKEKFDVAIDTMRLRGPDARGAEIHHEEPYNLGLGHRRLSVIDLDERANQPFHDNGLGIIYNGEIYNYKAIKDELIELNYHFKTTSDTEVILKAYEEWGTACVDRFLGMFAVAIYDQKKHKIILMRDRLGVKPLYVYQTEQLLVFSSDSMAINSLLNRTLKLDESALNGFFSLGYVPGLKSIFRQVKKLKPGSMLTVDLQSGKSKEKTYWNLNDYMGDNPFKAKDKAELKNILKDAVKLRLVSDVKVGSFLSGGLDSSYITKLLADQSREQLSSFTVGFDADFDEAPHAKKVAELIGTEHTTYYLKPKDISKILYNYSAYFTEPFADNTSIPMLYLSQHSKNKVKVVVSSDGGDELFAGYYEYLIFMRYIRRLNKIPKLLRVFLKPLLHAGYLCCPQNSKLKSNLWKLKNIVHYNADRQLNNLLFFGSRLSYPVLKPVIDKSILTKTFNADFDFVKLKTSSSLKKMLYTDITESLVNKMLVKVDKSTMGASIEGREPLLDHRLFEFMFSFSEENFIHNRITKYRFRELIQEEFNNDNLLNKPKTSFETPLFKWLKEHYSDYVENELRSIREFKIPYLHQNNLLKLWRSYHNIQHNKKELLWRALVFIQWYKMHMLQTDQAS